MMNSKLSVNNCITSRLLVLLMVSFLKTKPSPTNQSKRDLFHLVNEVKRLPYH